MAAVGVFRLVGRAARPGKLWREAEARRETNQCTLLASISVRWLHISMGRSLATEGENRVSMLLRKSLSPSYLKVDDISGGCGSAYDITIDSEQFKGKRTIQQHRLVTEALGEEMKSIHAVTIKIGNPDKSS